jgi:hypothetical protein
MTAAEVLRVDDMRPVLEAIRERGVRVDPLFAGECRHLFRNVGTRLRYCRKAGRTIDEVGELLWDRGFTIRRVSTVECLDLLETLFTPGVSTRVAQPSNRAIEKAAANHQIARGTRNSILLCGICWETNNEITHMVRVDPLPEEILERAA